MWRSGLTHAAVPESEIKQLVSYDDCASFEELRSIYLSKEWDTRNFASGAMGQGRIGLVAARFRGAGKQLEVGTPIFLFSDNGGVDWTSREFALPPSAPFVSFHGDIVRWPASAGGHDELGYAAFSYNYERKAIDGLYTRDNGNHWEWRPDLCVSDGGIAIHLTECWVSALREAGPWLMVVRPIMTGIQANAVFYLSDDLTSWSGPHDGGVMLSGNAPALIVDGERASLYTVARRGASRELPSQSGEFLGDRLLVAQASVADLIEGSVDFGTEGGWNDLGPLPAQAVGYIFPRKIRGHWFAVFNFGETGRVGDNGIKRSWLGLMTPHQPVAVDAPVLRAAIPLDNMIDNGDFSIWNRGDRFEAVRSGQVVADRWFVLHPSADSVAVEKELGPHPLGGPNTWLSKSCPGTSGKHQTLQTLGDVDSGAGRRVTFMFRASGRDGARLAKVALVQNFGVGGSKAQEIPLATDVALSDQPLLYTFSTALPTIGGKIIGEGAALRIVIQECTEKDTRSYSVIYGDCALVLGQNTWAVRPRSAAQMRTACLRYFQRLTLRGLMSGTGEQRAALLQTRFPAMARMPLARVISSDGSMLTQIVPLALSSEEICLVVGSNQANALATVDVDLDAEWTAPDLGSMQWSRDEAAPGLAMSREGFIAPVETLMSLASQIKFAETRQGLPGIRGSAGNLS